ncbi:hypothetical protein B0H12DRAFT_1325227 [Mycena haematopus]|nr:hypothetical protein B0H12DRAFT_1325227 [Mycena haematopus]
MCHASGSLGDNLRRAVVPHDAVPSSLLVSLRLVIALTTAHHRLHAAWNERASPANHICPFFGLSSPRSCLCYLVLVSLSCAELTPVEFRSANVLSPGIEQPQMAMRAHGTAVPVPAVSQPLLTPVPVLCVPAHSLHTPAPTCCVLRHKLWAVSPPAPYMPCPTRSPQAASHDAPRPLPVHRVPPALCCVPARPCFIPHDPRVLRPSPMPRSRIPPAQCALRPRVLPVRCATSPPAPSVLRPAPPMCCAPFFACPCTTLHAVSSTPTAPLSPPTLRPSCLFSFPSHALRPPTASAQ